MYHYTTSTYLTLPSFHQVEIWQTLAPREAFSRDFLMHGILAISASHLSHLHPSSSPRYTNLAMQHYTSAIGLLTSILNNINPENAVAVFLLSALEVLISYATPPDKATESMQHVLDIFRLQRGIRDVLDAGRKWLHDTQLEPMLKPHFNKGDNADALQLPPEDEAMLRFIEQRIDAEPDLSATLRTAYIAAVRDMRQCYPFESRKQDHEHILLRWPVKVPAEFFAAAVERRTIAVALLAYYGTLLHVLKDVWWAGHKGRLLVSAASSLLPLGSEWEGLVRWARKRVGVDNHC